MTWLGEQLGRIADDMPERDLGARAIEAHQRRRRNFMALTAAVVVVITVLAATVGVRALPAEPRAAARPSSPPEKSTIRVGVVQSVESAPVYVALAKGYFKEEGLTVEPRPISSVAAAVPQVEGGALDLAQTDYATVFKMNELGVGEFKIVSSLHQAAQGSFAVTVKTKSKIRTVADLKHKKIAIAGRTGLGALVLAAMLKQAGISWRDVLLVEVPYTDMIVAMDKGQVDAALMTEPLITLGREVGITRIVSDAMPREAANLYSAGMMATDKWIRGHPRTLAAFQRALVKAQRLIASNPQQVRNVLPGYTKISKAMAADVPLGSYPARLDLTELQRVADLARAYKMITRPADLMNAVAKGG
ncbi:ABC transporter substrate-binding protein [Nonomuraea sp. NPDC026600]|uniref:ABC transporter substrate-binding protein n=1 Tax=Nonomuraea sp. NPDC026600 TaxID=3155363 RepID=UPI00340E9B8E